MIRLDYRTGSGELERLFLPFGIKVVKVKLDFGDFDFTGKGPAGECAVVIERKNINDLIQSIESKRLAGHQLPGMAAAYDYCYLIVEGIWRPAANGAVEIWQGWGTNGKWVEQGFHSRAIINYLMGLSLRAGVIVWRTASDIETVGFVVDQYAMWQKNWSEHRCHDAVYAPAAGGSRKLSLMPRDVSIVEKVAAQLPGLDARARAVARSFKSVLEMSQAGEERWARVEWVDKNKKKRKLGAVTARKIVEALTGGN